MMHLPHLRSFPALVLGAAIGLSAMMQSGTAEAGHVHFSGGARFSARGGGRVSVHFARPVFRPTWRHTWRPRTWVGGSVWFGRGYYYPRPYYYYAPEYVPSYYGATYYPVQPAVAPGVVAAAPAARPALPTFGLGVFAGGSSVQNVDNQLDTQDLGVLGRLRLTPGLLIEGELAKTSFKDNERVDRRIGASLIYEIGARNTFAPYLLAGGGVQQADVAGTFSTTQDFGEIGVGLRWALSRNLHLAFDIRAGRSTSIDSNQPGVVSNAARSVAPPPVNGSDNTEDYTRGRLAAILNF